MEDRTTGLREGIECPQEREGTEAHSKILERGSDNRRTIRCTKTLIIKMYIETESFVIESLG